MQSPDVVEALQNLRAAIEADARKQARREILADVERTLLNGAAVKPRPRASVVGRPRKMSPGRAAQAQAMRDYWAARRAGKAKARA